MHKLVLGSGGVFFQNESDLLIDHIISLIDDKSAMKMVYFPTGSHDCRGYEKEVEKYCLNHGFKESVALFLSDESLSEEYIRDTILSASVIYCCGGDLKYVMEMFSKKNVGKYLHEAYDNGVVIAGQSTGSMCFCRLGYDNCGKDGRFMFKHGLDFIPYILCPHFEDYPHFRDAVKMQEYDAICIDNDIMMSIVDGEYEIIDSHRNDKHSAWFLKADEDWDIVHDLQKEHIDIPNLR